MAIPETQPQCYPIYYVQWYGWQFWIRESKARFIKNYFNTTFLNWCSYPADRLTSILLLHLGWVAKSLVEIFSIAQTLAFMTCRTAIGAPLQGCVNTPRVYQLLFCVVSSKACFIFLAGWRRCSEIIPGSVSATRNPPEKRSLCCLVQDIIEDTDTGIHPEPVFLLNFRIATGNREDAPWSPVGYLNFHLVRTKLFITTTGSSSLIPRTALSCWIVAFVWRDYERLVIPMPPAHGICTQVHYPRILCQTAVYFTDVLVFHGRTVGNSPVHWTEILVLHFIGSNKWAEYTYLGVEVWGSCPTWFSDGKSSSVVTDFTPQLHICTVAYGFSRTYFEAMDVASPPNWIP